MDQQFGRKRVWRKLAAFAAITIGVALGLLGWMYWSAIRDPIVRTARVEVRGLADPVRILLLSDIHVAGPDMPPDRVERIVRQANALRPDLILIAGDFISDKRSGTRSYPLAQAIAPLAGLKARLGVTAVLGNHDHWRNAAATRYFLRESGIRVLDNDAARVGPLSLGGVDDPFTGQEDVAQVLIRMRAYPGVKILLSHSPDIFPRVPSDVPLTLAGHTHCGQIRLPFVGAVSTMSKYGEQYACGRIDEKGRALIVSSGLGTSILPLRLGAAPDLWVIDLAPAPAQSS
jgi:predicted MPP superfamily phosphohydrolase